MCMRMKPSVHLILYIEEVSICTTRCDIKNSTFCWRSVFKCRSQWPRGLRRRNVAARLLRSWVRIPFFSELQQLSGCWVCCFPLYFRCVNIRHNTSCCILQHWCCFKPRWWQSRADDGRGLAEHTNCTLASYVLYQHDTGYVGLSR